MSTATDADLAWQGDSVAVDAQLLWPGHRDSYASFYPHVLLEAWQKAFGGPASCARNLFEPPPAAVRFESKNKLPRIKSRCDWEASACLPSSSAQDQNSSCRTAMNSLTTSSVAALRASW